MSVQEIRVATLMTFISGDRGFLWKVSFASAVPLTLIVLFHGIIWVTEPLLLSIVSTANSLAFYEGGPDDAWNHILFYVIFSGLTLATGTLVLATWTLIWYVVFSVLLFAVKQVRGRNGTAELGIGSRRYRETADLRPGETRRRC